MIRVQRYHVTRPGGTSWLALGRTRTGIEITIGHRGWHITIVQRGERRG